MASLSSSAALSIECSDQPLDLSFHPSRPSLVAAALVDGTVEVHDINELLLLNDHNNNKNDDDDETDEPPDSILSSTPLHTTTPRYGMTGGNNKNTTSSARCIEFSADGRRLFSGGSAGDLVGVEADRITSWSTRTHLSSTHLSDTATSAAAIVWRVPEASYSHSPLQIVKELEMDLNHMIVTGDEVGGVRVWDLRLLDAQQSSAGENKSPRGCVYSWKTHEDYISGVDGSAENGNTLLVSSADCTLSVYDLRKGIIPAVNPKERCIKQSDDQEDELLSIQVIKNGRKVVCGTGQGVLAVWSYGTWGDISDRFPGHPASVDALLKVDEDTLLTGSSDGLLRVVSIHPDKFLGVLGDHDGFPIEKLEMNANRSYVGSVTHDSIIRLWDATILNDDFNGLKPAKIEDTKCEQQGSEDDWEDMDEDDSDDDSDARPGSSHDNGASGFRTENEKFFDDL